MKPLTNPILTAHLFGPVDGHLLELLESLSPTEWQKQTYAPKWTVKDVAGHLLDTALRRLSIARDQYTVTLPELRTDDDLVHLVNDMNHQGVEFFKRMSPRLLTTLLKIATEELSAYFSELDPFAKAPLAVSWAGEQESPNWFDIAREYTERWHHQQQIRDAVNRPGILNRRFYYPVLDCFMRSLPHAYRNANSPESTGLSIHVSGESGGEWYLYKAPESWQLLEGPAGNCVAQIVIPETIAWRIFTKGISRSDAEPLLQTTGDREIAMNVLNSLAIVG